MELLKYCLDRLTEKGAQKAEVYLVQENKEEMNIHSGDISLLRSLEEYNLEMTALIDNKKDMAKVNKIDEESINTAIDEIIENAKNSEADLANDIPEIKFEKVFNDTVSDLDIEKMHKRLKEFIEDVNKDYEHLVIEEAILEHNRISKYFANSNGTQLSSTESHYNFTVMFFAKKGKLTSSFNYVMQSAKDLDKAILEMGALKKLLKESIEHLEPKAIDVKKFTGDVIVTPECMNDMGYFLLMHLTNQYLIPGVSKFKGKLGEKLLDEKLTVTTEPDSKELAIKDYFGKDGYINKNEYIFQNGVLKNYLLDHFGSLKTGYERGPSTGSNLVIEAGNISIDEMVKSMDQGIILARFSGGMPAPNGDFSGIAKNSYYVKDGKIQYPIKETMISGNLFEMFQNIKGVSKERINNGQTLMPYMQFGNATISSK